MSRLPIPRLRPVHWCAATLSLFACSGPESEQPSDDSMGNPASMTPGVGAPGPVSPSPLAPIGPSLQSPGIPENDPAPVGLGPEAPPSGVNGADAPIFRIFVQPSWPARSKSSRA
jgi:hypothetical protein